MKKAVMMIGTILLLVAVLNFTNTMNQAKVQENITITANKSEKLGSVWYVNDMILDASFKRGFSNPNVGDAIDIGLDDKGIVVDWKVNN